MLTHEKILGTVGYMGGIMALPEPFVWSWTQMIEFNRDAIQGGRIKYTHTKYSLHSAARNDLIYQMRGDWLLQLDTDLVFDPDFVTRLLTIFERYKLDILTGMYVYKSNPAVPTIYAYNQENGRHEHIGRWDEDVELFEVDSAGGGCLLVRKEVYERIVEELHQPPFEMTPPYGEDHSFFMRARKLGYKAFCAWKVQAAHLGYKEVVHQPDYSLEVVREVPVTVYGTPESKGAQIV